MFGLNKIMCAAREPQTKLHLSEIYTFKNLFSTLQCNPYKSICLTNNFLLDKSGQKMFFLANLMIDVKNVPTPDIDETKFAFSC